MSTYLLYRLASNVQTSQNNEHQHYKSCSLILPHKAYSEQLVSPQVRFPSLSSCHWCLKLYGLVMGGMGILFTFLWIIIHIYVLTQIENDADLKVQR